MSLDTLEEQWNQTGTYSIRCTMGSQTDQTARLVFQLNEYQFCPKCFELDQFEYTIEIRSIRIENFLNCMLLTKF